MYSRKTILLLAGAICSVCLKAQPGEHFSIIIDEIFADPSPPVALPNSEYLELKNISLEDVDLTGWSISDGSSTAVLPAGTILMPDSFLIVCPPSSASLFSGLPVTGVRNFPSLNNDGDELALYRPGGQLAHWISYSLASYQNEVKSRGGWSLEMIDCRYPCQGPDNWGASIDPSGGSPGRMNSLDGNHPDNNPPELIRTYTLDTRHIVAVFSESLDSLEAARIINYAVIGAPLSVIRARPLAPVFREVELELSNPMGSGNSGRLQAANLTDCSGNRLDIPAIVPFGQPAENDAIDLVINEILFNPPADGHDYLEFYNRGEEPVDLRQIFLASRDAGGNLRTPAAAIDFPFLVFPGDYLVISEDPNWVNQAYRVARPSMLVSCSSLPSLPDDKGSLVVLARDGRVVDELQYSHTWHFPLVVQEEGLALERLDATAKTQDPGNWTTAAASAGYGTPTAKNSQWKSTAAASGVIEIDPKIFSPDNDGRDDYVLIRYHFDDPGNVAKVAIFDARGVLVRQLVNNILAGESGFWRWDGLDEVNRPLPSGPYIVLVQVFNRQGYRKSYKKAVILARY